MSALTVIGAVVAWTGFLLLVVGLCKSAHEGDILAGDALDELEARDNLRPLSSAVSRPPAADPVVRLMREGLTADDAVRRVYFEGSE